MTVFTIGHSTRAAGEFLALLQANRIQRVVDVRRYPASRRHPHFSRESLALSLPAAGISYVHEPALGGRRAPAQDSPNGAWRSSSFRGYADYMGSREFSEALARVMLEARELRTALLCAEAVPWRCHRQLIADALVARGVEVRHILGGTALAAHVLNPGARVGEAGALTYPPAGGVQERLW